MLTIDDVLKMPAFERAKLVAGDSGRTNTIRWVHIVSMPESQEYYWTKGNELILTVGFGLRAAPELPARLIPKLIEHGIAGLVLSVGHYFDKVPQSMIDEANRLDFPVIELPGDVAFVEVTEAVFTSIVNEQYQILQRVQWIHEQLTDVVLDGGTLQDVAGIVARLLDKSLTIESTDFEVLANVQRGEVDEARIRSVESGHTTPEMVEQLEGRATSRQLLRDKRPIRIRAQPEMGLEMERIVAPIIVARKIIGYMWIIADGGPLTALDEQTIAQAATVAALLMYKEKAVNETRRMLRGDFFDQLLSVDQDNLTHLEGQAKLFDFRLDQRYQVLVMEEMVPPPNEISTLPERVEHYVREFTQALITTRERQIVVVLQAKQNTNGKQVAEQLQERLKSAGNDALLIGVGMPVERPSGILESYQQAKESLVVARNLDRRYGVYTFDGLGMLHWLQTLPDAVLRNNWYFRLIADLDAHDEDQNKQLLETLEAFLECGGSLKDASERLFVHRNTLTYRLERIEAHTGLDLRDTQTQANLFVALQGYRLRQHD